MLTKHCRAEIEVGVGWGGVGWVRVCSVMSVRVGVLGVSECVDVLDAVVHPNN